MAVCTALPPLLWHFVLCLSDGTMANNQANNDFESSPDLQGRVAILKDRRPLWLLLPRMADVKALPAHHPIRSQPRARYQ